jgi:putative membrane protein
MKHKFSINVVVVLGIVALALIGSNSLQGAPVKSKSNITNNRTKGGQLSSADKAFIKDAASGGMMEVAMGRVAEKNATDAEVKNFGARMVKDHSKANDELKALAKEENVELPAAKEPSKWKSDKDYMDMMVKDHEKDLAAFEKEAKEGTDPDVKNFASKTSETVRKHLDMAKKIDGKLK